MRCIDVSEEPSASVRSIQSARLHGATFQKAGILLSLPALLRQEDVKKEQNIGRPYYTQQV